MQTIPLQPVPSQTVKVVLANQNCQITLRHQTQGLFADVVADGVTLTSTTIARDAVPIMPRDYLAFAGNLVFVDTQGADDPTYTGLGSRFQLVYLTAEEYALVQQ